MQVGSSLKASPDLTPSEAAQAPASADTQAFLTANNLQAFEVQLSQPVADLVSAGMPLTCQITGQTAI